MKIAVISLSWRDRHPHLDPYSASRFDPGGHIYAIRDDAGRLRNSGSGGTDRDAVLQYVKGVAFRGGFTHYRMADAAPDSQPQALS